MSYMSYVTFDRSPLEATPSGNEELIRTGFLDALDLVLPAIVLRDFGKKADKVSRALGDILGSEIELFDPSIFPPIDHASERQDFGLHIDELDEHTAVRPDITVWTI